MADTHRDGGGGGGGGGLLDLEGELTCSICTDLLYAPLTLLDCLHSFCGACLKEWFTWQATANATSKKLANPYTCPSCRESVRDTKVDWRLTTLLEGFLKANPDRGKTQEEKDEASKLYKPGDNVIPPVQVEDQDSEDERLMADVRELSMAHVDPDTARRRTERTRARQRRSSDRSPRYSSRQGGVHRYGELQRSSEDRHVEHQPSLRSLLSDSDIDSEDVQQEILRSIYSDGLLNGIDVDNLTPEQEEALTERIADAYRRRQRNRDRSRNRVQNESSGHSPRPSGEPRDRAGRGQSRSDSLPSHQTPDAQPRARPPISRPHLFEQTSAGAESRERRSASSSSHHRRPSSSNIPRSTDHSRQPTRSATDLSQTLNAPEQRPRASSSNARSTTDPSNLRNEIRRVRDGSDSHQPGTTSSSSRPRSRELDPVTRQTGAAATITSAASAASASAPAERSTANQAAVPSAVRPAISTSAFAPEPVSISTSVSNVTTLPAIACSRCERQHIEEKLHYHCAKCDGDFNLCQQCYRSGRGCHHWFGFGFAAMHNWQRHAPPEGYPREYERPHILTPRRYISSSSSTTPYPDTQKTTLQEGAFCDSCSTFANECYWYCEFCLYGSWGFCNPCILRGHQCTHPLLPLAHISHLENFSHDPSQLAFLPVPHLKDHSYVLRPILTDCDICGRDIPAPESRFHCYSCGHGGDYDICNTCYTNLVRTGKISRDNGPNGWRRCLKNHRMAVVGYENTPYGGGQVRITLADPVGGWRLKEDPASSSRPPSHPPPPPPQSSTVSKQRFLATWSWFPESTDELAFPQGAEITECEELNDDWAVGVYAGKVGVFPKNHTERI